MKNFKLLLSCRIFLAVVVVTLFASGVAEAQSTVPFKGTFAIAELLQSPDETEPCFQVGVISGSGPATPHVGKLTLVSRDCIIPMSATAFLFSSNQLVFTVVATGEQIVATYGGIFTIEGTVGVITGGYNIDGGTGRFLHARGVGTVQGVEDLSTGQGSVQLNGTITY
jgi:hypothetical protein